VLLEAYAFIQSRNQWNHNHLDSSFGTSAFPMAIQNNLNLK